MAQYQSQCWIFANQQLKVSNIFICSCCFRPTATWLSFRCWPTFISQFTDCFHWANQPSQPFTGNFTTIVWYPKPSFRNVSIRSSELYLCTIFYHNQRYRPNCDYDLKYWTCYNAMLHVNIKIMTSQQRWYLLLSYFNNDKFFLFSCEIRSWSLRFRQFDICLVNTAESNTLLHSIVTNRWAIFGAKNIQAFLRYSNFHVGIFYFVPHPVYVRTQLQRRTSYVSNYFCCRIRPEGLLCDTERATC